MTSTRFISAAVAFAVTLAGLNFLFADIQVGDSIYPVGSYPSHYAQYGYGGHRTVTNYADLALIHSSMIETGMTAWVIASNMVFVYTGTWGPLSVGGSGDLTSIGSADGSVVVTSGGGPDVDVSVTNYVAGVVLNYLSLGGNVDSPMTGPLDLGGQNITNVTDIYGSTITGDPLTLIGVGSIIDNAGNTIFDIGGGTAKSKDGTTLYDLNTAASMVWQNGATLDMGTATLDLDSANVSGFTAGGSIDFGGAHNATNIARLTATDIIASLILGLDDFWIGPALDYDTSITGIANVAHGDVDDDRMLPTTAWVKDFAAGVADGGATQLISRVGDGAWSTSAYDAATATLTISNPAPTSAGGGGDVYLASNNTHAAGTTNTFDDIIADDVQATTFNGAALPSVAPFQTNAVGNLYDRVGGHSMTASAGYNYNVIGGGYGNTNAGEGATIAGGRANRITINGTGQQSHDFIGGGSFNEISHLYNATFSSHTIVGGWDNKIQGGWRSSFIGAGMSNLIRKVDQGAILSGFKNLIYGDPNISDSMREQPTIMGGRQNTIWRDSQYAYGKGDGCLIVYGQGNGLTNCNYSTIFSGGGNSITNGSYSYILGGVGSFLDSASYVFALGYNNDAKGVTDATMLGRNCNATNNQVILINADPNTTLTSVVNSQILMRAVSGVGVNTNNPQSAFHVGSGDIRVDSNRKYMLGSLAWLTLDASGTNLLFVAGTNIANVVTNQVNLTAL